MTSIAFSLPVSNDLPRLQEEASHAIDRQDNYAKAYALRAEARIKIGNFEVRGGGRVPGWSIHFPCLSSTFHCPSLNFHCRSSTLVFLVFLVFLACLRTP